MFVYLDLAVLAKLESSSSSSSITRRQQRLYNDLTATQKLDTVCHGPVVTCIAILDILHAESNVQLINKTPLLNLTTTKYILNIHLTTPPRQRLRLVRPLLPTNHINHPKRRRYRPILIPMQLPIYPLIRQ